MGLQKLPNLYIGYRHHGDGAICRYVLPKRGYGILQRTIYLARRSAKTLGVYGMQHIGVKNIVRQLANGYLNRNAYTSFDKKRGPYFGNLYSIQLFMPRVSRQGERRCMFRKYEIPIFIYRPRILLRQYGERRW